MNTLLLRTRYVLPLFFLCFALGLTACESEEPNVGTTIEDVTDPDVDDGIFGAQELYEGYNPYVGQTVTVSGEIAEVYGPNSLLIGEDLWGENLLVVIPSDATISGTTPAGTAVTGYGDLGTEYVLQVTGTVRQYVVADIETEYGLDIPAEVEVEIEEQEPMIVASSVMVMTEEMTEEL